MFLRTRDLDPLRAVARIDVRDRRVVARDIEACEAEWDGSIGAGFGGDDRRTGGLAWGSYWTNRPPVMDRFCPLSGAHLGPDCGHGNDICQGFIQIPHRDADHFAVLLLLVKDHQLGFDRGA